MHCHTQCAVLLKKTVQFKSLLLGGPKDNEINSIENSRFRYAMIGETQPEMELLEVVAFIYPFYEKQ